jgi:hypothetical protein
LVQRHGLLTELERHDGRGPDHPQVKIVCSEALI